MYNIKIMNRNASGIFAENLVKDTGNVDYLGANVT